LTVADDLNKAGCEVTVYDSAKQPGGVLRYGIPDFKLSKDILDRRINLMREEGVVFECGVSAGDDISFKFLRDRYDAICLACGAREPRDIKVPGRELKGIHFALDYLSQQNRRLAGEAIAPEDVISAEGKVVVVIGGGDTGSDCLGTALRQGAKHVYQFEIMPRPADRRPERTPWPMWPDICRESSSHKEGGERRWGVSTKKFSGANGFLEKMSCIEVEWVTAADGKPEMREKPGTEFDIDAQVVLLAMGFTGAGRNTLVEDIGLEKDSRGNIRTDGCHGTSIEGVFSAGDMAKGQSLVVRAIADGKTCARDIMDWQQKKHNAVD
jgi:glutamate synthase (NADPH/NADH) small chain